jgi:hypothetical protein
MRMSTSSFRGRSLITAVAVLGATSAFAAWSASGTVKTTGGVAIKDVIVTVKDSATTLRDTTDASGAFMIGRADGILEPAVRAFAAQVVGNELLVTSPKDGSLDLALIDASGRSMWSATAMATQGTAHVALPTGLSHGAVFLRIRHADGVQYQAVTMGAGGIQVSAPSARSLAANPVLQFSLKPTYNDTTYAMTASSQTGIAVVMSTANNQTCAFPTTFSWKDYGSALASPASGLVSIKDFTNVTMSDGKHLIYSSTYSSAYGSEGWAPFTNWSDAASAKQTKMNMGTVAPELIYFTPQKKWILTYQWSTGYFTYATSSDPTNANGWTKGGSILDEKITGSASPIDQVVICDATNCYLFYAADNGKIYRASMAIGNFPGVFSGSKELLSDTQANLFEAVEVYTIKGTGKYLMIVECMGTYRYFRAFTATSLGGTWTAISNATGENTPFAGRKNISNPPSWTGDVSHGDLVRGADETRTVDPCNMQLLYQGYSTSWTGSDYNLKPYKLGLLTFTGK